MNFHYLNIPNKVPARSKTTSFVHWVKKHLSLCIAICQTLKICTSWRKSSRIAETISSVLSWLRGCIFHRLISHLTFGRFIKYNSIYFFFLIWVQWARLQEKMGRKRAKVNITNYQASRVQQGWSDVKEVLWRKTFRSAMCVILANPFFLQCTESNWSFSNQEEPKVIVTSEHFYIPENDIWLA